eukprot:4676933-Alexandrium_andersonii.AAC.1
MAGGAGEKRGGGGCMTGSPRTAPEGRHAPASCELLGGEIRAARAAAQAAARVAARTRGRR